MKFSFANSLEKRSGDVLVLPFWEGPKEASDSSLVSGPVLKDFHGKHGECAFTYVEGERILLLGLGKQEKATVEVLRKAYAAAVRAVTGKKLKKLDLVFPNCKQKDQFFRGIAEGLLLTNYVFTYKEHSLKEKPLVQISEAHFIGISRPKELSEIETIIDGVKFVRDLVNENADAKIPEKLAEIAKKLHPKVKVTIFDRKKLEAEKMGLILAVGRASMHDPRLIQATYRGNPSSKQHIVLVGKGVTYDTGGLSLKPTDGMLGMKCDMAGGAAVLGAVRTAAELGLKVNVTALVPSVENCIGSRSYKLGDVYRSYSGKTVEINNTDAEGRLVLADALAYAVDQLKPTCMVDLATLTGAAVVALGEEISAFFTSYETLADDLLDSAEAVDELVCRLPIHNDYKEAYHSEIADMTNSGGRDAGSIKGALFLQEFVGEVPWAHFDIAGPAFLSKPKHYNPMKGTGYALRTLVDFLAKKAGKSS